MGSFIKATSTTDIPDGSMKHVAVQGKEIAITRIGDTFFAVDDTCTHERCSLSDEGFLDGNIVTCGCHGGQFDITTGKVLSLPPPADLHTYNVQIQGTDILIEL